MSIRQDRLEQLLLCIGAKCDLQEEIVQDARFGIRLQACLRGCLDTTTRDAESFMESVFGRATVRAYREARRLAQEPLHRPVGASNARDLQPAPLLQETSH